MQTTLNAHGQLRVPRKVRQADYLSPRKLFDLERFTPANYLLPKTQYSGARSTIANGDAA
ncbi:MAG TPA: hypothetical protein VEL06_16810 [Haliangiales bacterium]|nr:hypothetical protein [Haliangiales bacterium]